MNNNNKNKVSEEKLFFFNWTFSFLNLKFLDIKEERSIECKLFDALIFKKIKKKNRLRFVFVSLLFTNIVTIPDGLSCIQRKITIRVFDRFNEIKLNENIDE